MKAATRMNKYSVSCRECGREVTVLAEGKGMVTVACAHCGEMNTIVFGEKMSKVDMLTLLDYLPRKFTIKDVQELVNRSWPDIPCSYHEARQIFLVITRLGRCKVLKEREGRGRPRLVAVQTRYSEQFWSRSHEEVE